MKKYVVWTGSTVYHVIAKTRLDAIIDAATKNGAANPIASAKSGYWHARLAQQGEKALCIRL